MGHKKLLRDNPNPDDFFINTIFQVVENHDEASRPETPHSRALADAGPHHQCGLPHPGHGVQLSWQKWSR